MGGIRLNKVYNVLEILISLKDINEAEEKERKS